MKMFRKLVSIVAAATVLTSSLAFTFSAGAATQPAETETAADANLQSDVQKGVILHAFNWSYNAIKEKLPEIAAAGYSTVQTSPVQQPKDFGLSTDVAGQWWKLYQPVSMQIAQQSWLGTKAELTSLCSEADKYGIKIICDIVSNHFGNETEMSPNSLSEQVKTYQPDFYNNRTSYFRNNNLNPDDNSVQKTVQGHVSNCPDLNTGNSAVQQAALNLLKSCIDCGVDGFRFDAAKHIETPSDGSYSSQYWPVVANGAKSYYQQKTGKNLFIYGEILNTCGTGRSFSHYTPYINVTDNKTGDGVLAAVNNKQAGSAASSSYVSGVAASKVVLWAESHDTYEGNSGSAGIGNTSGVSDETVAKAWAIVAARKDATALFFARPGSAHMGEAATDATYKSTAVAEVNKFHNLFTNDSEKLGSSGSIAYVQRGGKGIVLSNVSGNATSVNIGSTGMANGTYTDMVSGNTFTVSGGTLTGNIGSTGIAVIYNGRPTPRATSSVESGTFKDDTLTVKLSLENAVKGTYCLDDSSPVAFTNGNAIKIGSDYNYGETITLTLTATDQYGTTETNVYKYKKEKNTGSGIYIWLNPAKKTTWEGPFNVYMFDEETVGKSQTYTNAPAWPGEAMTYDETQKMWYYEVPTTSYLNGQPNSFDLSKSNYTSFIINATSKSTHQTVQFPAANSSGVAPKQYLKGHSWEYAVTSGTSITASTRVPTKVNIPATVATKGMVTEPPTTTQPPTTTAPPTTKPQPTTVAPTTAAPTTKPQPTTAAPTTAAPTTKPQPTTAAPTTVPATTAPPTVYYYGDVDGNGVVDITDATLIQLHIAGSNPLSGIPLILADVDNDGDVDITDATLIQLYISLQKDKSGRTGEPYLVYPEVPTQTPTTGKSLTVTATSNIFPKATTTFDPIADQITVTYWINIKDYLMVNSQWTIDYDESVLKLDETAGVNKAGRTYTNIFRATKGTGNVVVNTAPTSKPEGCIKANATNLDGYALTTDDGGRVPFVSVTFNPVAGATGKTFVNLDVEVMQLTDGQGAPFYFIEDSKIVRPDISYLPSDTATAVYAGVYKDDAQQQPDVPTPAPGPLTVTAYSNIFPQATTTFDPVANQITVTYWINLKADMMINAQWKLTYDKDVLEIDPTNANKNGRYYNFFRATEGRFTTTNLNPVSAPDGGAISCNATNVDGFDLTAADGGRVPFVSVTFNPLDNAKGTTKVYLDVEYLQLGNGTDEQYYFINNSQIVRPDISYLPSDTATAVYAGVFDNTKQQAPDENQPTTAAPATNPPTDPVTDPVTDPITEPVTDPITEPVTDPITEPVTEPWTDPVYDITVKFTNNFGWPTVYVHAWDADGNDLDTWPGNEMTNIGDNGYGQDNFEGTIPGNAAGCCFTAGPEGPQTGNVTDFSAEGWFVNEKYTEINDFTGATVFTPLPWGFEIGGGEGSTIKFTNNQKWSTVYLHAWGPDGDLDQWPGVEMTNIGDNGYGSDNYEGTIPAGAIGICFTDGNAQTSDVTDFSVEGYFTDASRTEFNDFAGKTVFTALPWGTEIGGGEGGGTIKFTNNLGWSSVYLHAWGPDGDLDQWPGNAMTNIGDNGYGSDNYEGTIPAGAVGICFTDGNAQTSDVTDFSAEGYFIDASHTEFNEFAGKTVYTAYPWGTELGGGGGEGGDGVTVKFTNNLGWSSVYVHAWDGNGNELDQWPGIAMTNIGDNGYGQDNYQATIPAGAAGCCFTNGDAQTSDVTDFSAEGYFIDASHTEFNEFAGKTVYTAYPWGTELGGGGQGGQGGGDGVTVKFTNNLGWSSVYVHAWDGSGNELDQWPGIAMTNIGDNGYGQDNYQATLPAGAAGCCFSNGDAQTSDVTDFSAEGYFIDASHTEFNEFAGKTVYTAYPWGTELGGGGQGGQGGESGGDGVTVKFTNNLGWSSVYVHAWDGSGNELTQWPGIAMTNIGDNGYGQDNYQATLPAGAAGCCFSNGDAQTSDVTDFSAEGYFIDASHTEYNEFAGKNVYTAFPWGTELGGGGQGGQGGESGGDGVTVKFTNNLGWSSVYVHAWDGSGNELTQWPGIAMTNIGDNGYGQDNYQATLPSGAAGCCFSNGDAQTSDVTDFSAEGYFIDASHTEYNEFAGKNVYTAFPWGTELGGGGQGSQGGESSGTYTVRFSSNWGGTMRCYYWNDGESPVQWSSAPEMNVEQQDNGYGETVYIYEVPTAYNMVIFQNGSKQTININTNSQSTNYYAMTEKEGNNYKVGTW